LISESPVAAIAPEIAAPQDSGNADEYIPTVVLMEWAIAASTEA